MQEPLHLIVNLFWKALLSHQQQNVTIEQQL